MQLSVELTARKLKRRASMLGTGTASVFLLILLGSFASKPGEPRPAAMVQTQFTVAVLAGPKQAAQTAPENVENTAEAVKVTPKKKDAQVVEAQRSTSLPEAVSAAPQAEPVPEQTKPVDVIPPAQVSMPGGRLASTDAPIGDTPDPFAIGGNQVYLRFLVDENGRVIRGGIVRGGKDPMRDGFIYKAMKSRTYSTKNLLRVNGGQPLWQLDLVIDYGSNEFLP